MLRERPQVQVDGGEPALAGVEQRFRLRVGKLRAAAVRVNGQLRMVQPQLLCAEPVDPRPQPDDLCGGQKAVAAGDDQVDVGGHLHYLTDVRFFFEKGSGETFFFTKKKVSPEKRFK